MPVTNRNTLIEAAVCNGPDLVVGEIAKDAGWGTLRLIGERRAAF